VLTSTTELLGPLKHPSELATHPSLSLPFLDPALPNMIEETEAKLRQERANLWRAKHLHRELIGDESWMPLERVETQDDWDLFEPKPKPAVQPSRKRKRNENVTLQNGVDERHHALGPAEPQRGDPTEDTTDNAMLPREEKDEAGVNEVPTNGDVAMQDGDMPLDETSESSNENEAGTTGADIVTAKATGDNGANETPSNGIPASIDGTTPPPPRRITRALAAEHNTNDSGSTRSRSPSSSSVSSSLLTPDPIFLLPPSLSSTARLQNLLQRLRLPAEEVLETRRLLTMYIQKQEETVRGYDGVLAKLIKAKRMRNQLWEWCKAEGHVGEWSDGEDWIDAEAWGEKEEDLRKGKDEDEGEAEREEAAAAAQVARAKGKRRRRERE
jgi:hypothetical protein